jgi:hypothetical protein
MNTMASTSVRSRKYTTARHERGPEHGHEEHIGVDRAGGFLGRLLAAAGRGRQRVDGPLGAGAQAVHGEGVPEVPCGPEGAKVHDEDSARCVGRSRSR